MTRIVIPIIIIHLYTLYINAQNSSSDLLVAIAETQIGKPYKSSTLNRNDEENISLNTESFDCVSYIEWVLAQVIAMREPYCQMLNIEEIIISLKYRDGCFSGYSSRCHYFSDWITQNIRNGYIEEITERISGAERKTKPIHYMTSNKHLYPMLKDSIEIHWLLEVEKKLSSENFFMIPAGKVSSILNELQHGDILAFTTLKKGLDICHVGIVYNTPGGKKLLHASQIRRRVVISEDNIDSYIRKNKMCNGIRVLRVRV